MYKLKSLIVDVFPPQRSEGSLLITEDTDSAQLKSSVSLLCNRILGPSISKFNKLCPSLQ